MWILEMPTPPTGILTSGSASLVQCRRKGSYRLARLAEKYGADRPMDQVLRALTADSRMHDVHHPAQGRCRARFIDLDPPTRPPHVPAPVMRLVMGEEAA